jgi:protein involved in polysaccharide export with SLBB domain
MSPISRIHRGRLLAAGLALTFVTAPQLFAQSDGVGILATRDALRQEMARLEDKGNKGRAGAELIRARLENGDFQAGDRVFIRVEGEAQLTDTFVVMAGPQLELPQVGNVALQGVLRSELQERLKAHLSRYLREPVVEARPLIRVLIEGGVVRPGYYGAAPQQPVVDVIAQAGGFTPTANAREMRIERGEQVIWKGKSLSDAMGHGQSVDQLSLRAGDRLFVPVHRDGMRALTAVYLVASIGVMMFSISQINH